MPHQNDIAFRVMMEEEEFDDIDVNALLDEIEGEKAKPKINMKKVLIDVNVPFLDATSSLSESHDTDDTQSKGKTNKSKKTSITNSDSVVHTGETDSSDDEDNKYFEERTYNTCGKDLKLMLKKKKGSSTNRSVSISPPVNPVNPSQAKTNHYVFGLNDLPSPKAPSTSNKTIDAYKDPIFGISIVNPLLSSTTLKSKMVGRSPIGFTKLKNHVLHGDLSLDWVLGGVIVNKTATKVSQKGKKYAIWTLSDLKSALLSSTLFLFGKAYEKLWKTQVGAVVGILNPTPLSQSEKGKANEATLSILDPDQVMLLGRSKDLGTCKGVKKDGNQCSSFVNVRECEYCMYHVAAAYNQYKGRAELQSPSGGTLRSLQNKVLGKSEVFYGGKSFMAQGGNKKVQAKDKQRLVNLGGPLKEPTPTVTPDITQLSSRATSLINMLGKSSNGTPSKSLYSKDASRLAALNSTPTVKSSGSGALKLKSGLKQPSLSNPESDSIDFDEPKPKPSVKSTTPQLSTHRPNKRPPEVKLQAKFNSLINLKKDSEKAVIGRTFLKPKQTSGGVENKMAQLKDDIKCGEGGRSETAVLEERSPTAVNALPVKGVEAIKTMVKIMTSPPSAKRSARAKLRAMEIIKKKGGITRDNPRGISREEIVQRGLKRHHEPNDEDESKEELKNSVLSARFIELMNMESKHADLLKEFDQQQEDAHFEKLEKREQMEEKMMNIFKVECKAVRCLKCRYTWFSASDDCKADRHPLKVVDAVKRFFKCNDCGNRTVSLSILPLLPCKKCSSTNWTKTSMMKEKIAKSSHKLSIRGGEQTFVNSVITDTNIDLLVPD